MTGENGKYNYSEAAHLYPPFSDIPFSAKNYKIASALTAEGKPLTPEEAERLEVSRSRKKNAYHSLIAQAENDPEAAAELAKKRAYASEATKKSRQKMYEEAEAGNPEAKARYESYLAARRESYHRKKQGTEAGETERTA